MRRVSVVTVCFNDLVNLRKTWDSLVSQTNRDWEWVVVDGGSSDGTGHFLEELLKEFPTLNIRYLSENDRGIYDAMNKGVTLAQGNYLIFMNSGDIFSDDSVLGNVSWAINKNSHSLLYGDSLERYQDGTLRYKPARHHKFYWYGMFAHHQAMFFHRDVFDNLRYPLEYSVGADYGLVCSILSKKLSCAHLGIPICEFLRGGLSTSYAGWKQGEHDQYLIRVNLQKMSKITALLIKLTHNIMYQLRTKHSSLYHLARHMNTR